MGMYWFRQSVFHVLPFLGLLLASWIGGWLLATHGQQLRARERLTAGLALGLVLFITLSNLFAQFIANEAAFVIAALLILIAGLVCAMRSKRPWFNVRDLKAWPQILAIGIIGLVFTFILRGMAIWDDYHNLPLVSTMAAGDIPPQYYLDPSIRLSYHYALHVFSASMVSLGGFTPWSAWDVARGLTTGIALVLAWLWFRRVTRNVLPAYFATTLLAFGGGALWLLSFLPAPWLASISDQIHYLSPGALPSSDLAQNLAGPFLFEGGPSLPLPFAHFSGIFSPIVIAWNGTSSLYLVGLFLLLLNVKRKHVPPISILISGIILAMLALNAEHVFALVTLGLAISVLIHYLLTKLSRKAIPLFLPKGILFVLLVAAIISLVQGGVLTEMIRGLIIGGANGSDGELGMSGFSFQWPPALVSIHFGSLSIFNPAQLIVGLAEIGPAILLLPLVIHWTRQTGKKGRWVEAGFGVAALMAFGLPFFVHYGIERDTSRITSFGLQIFLILGAPGLTSLLIQGRTTIRSLILAGFGISILSGIALFAIQLTAITAPQITTAVEGVDMRMSAAGWDQLEEDAQILSANPSLAATLYGRPSTCCPASWPIQFDVYPEWEALVSNPDPVAAAAAGYDYIYVDDVWWENLSPWMRPPFDQGCVHIAEEASDDIGNWRRLYDISDCK
jgi:hypothetical protein